jgi:hypothetical protein
MPLRNGGFGCASPFSPGTAKKAPSMPGGHVQFRFSPCSPRVRRMRFQKASRARITSSGVGLGRYSSCAKRNPQFIARSEGDANRTDQGTVGARTKNCRRKRRTDHARRQPGLQSKKPLDRSVSQRRPHLPAVFILGRSIPLLQKGTLKRPRLTVWPLLW